jgi:hypothetical protein
LLTDAQGIILNQDNGTQGCIDPEPYFDGTNADPLVAIQQQATTLVQAVAAISPTSPTALQQETLIGKVIDLIKQEIAAL